MKNLATILFRCPECRENFEFDMVGENEFVPCPMCGTDCVTIIKGNKLTLKIFGVSQNSDVQEILA